MNAEKSPSPLPIAVQLYSIREACAGNLADSLRAAADMGYDGVETAGFAGHAPAEFAAMVADNGLRVEGAHVGIDAVLPGAIDRTMADYAAIGCHRLVVPWIGGPWTADRDAWKRFLAVMNLAAEELAAHGFELGYHNHDFEFRYGPAGLCPFSAMEDGFTSRVKFQFDMGWVYAAGVDGIALAAAHPGRICSIHAKPYAKANPAPYLCEDDVDWKAVVAASAAAGADWVVVEHEAYAATPLECIRRDLANLHEALR